MTVGAYMRLESLCIGCHYRQNSAIVTFVNGAFFFINDASNFVYGAFVFVNGAPIFFFFLMVPPVVLT